MNREQADTPLRVVQITDSHLFRDPTAALLKLNTQISFDLVLELVQRKEENIDLILATGDIAQDASMEAYVRFGAAMEQLGAPFYWIPGNHDRRAVMEKVAAHKDAFINLVKSGNWQIVMLDSSIVGEVHGNLAPEELQHLESCLQAAQNDPAIAHTLVCLHHNPVPGSALWMDGIGLHNDEEFLAIVDRFKTVRAVVYGHIHQELDFLRKGVRYLCTPSTCIQFKPDVEDFALDDLNPAYRWFDLHRDGSIISGVERVTGHVFDVDHSSTGY
ncbi:MAG: 3',5'-cyclic-AMP phosphodiesterase [Gammaproteobacteria bacterium]|nr:3',5'-cyclic-AMP phosphodiesterase [Gammaproteobacteria bacterium]MDP2141055.1 3',5'-cyclic-AMP phosphodiesterase [Gammaproteobacteria bacterium]MDP2348513.1 3',5'-cyclic-AMP phosphodiesterase [Gammaproteobacteria bacterium]